MAEKHRVGIIGAGSIGHCHMEGYKKQSGVMVAAVCDINLERAEAFAKLYGIERVYSSYTEMLASCELDAVSVCTWNNVHAKISIAALEKGVNVLCEKPMAMTAKQAEEMEQAAKKANRVLMPGFCTRYEEGVSLLRECIKEKRLGDIYYIKATYLRRHGNPGGWFSDFSRSGGGPIIDLGVHVLDLARFLVGGDAASVSAITNKMPVETTQMESHAPHTSVEKEALHDVEDFACALIRLNNGVAIQFETSWNHHLAEDVFQLEVYGSKGGASCYPRLTLTTDDMGKMCRVLWQHSNHEDAPNYDFDRETAHFIAVAAGEEAPICTPLDGVEAMRIIDAVYESASSGHEITISR